MMTYILYSDEGLIPDYNSNFSNKSSKYIKYETF